MSYPIDQLTALAKANLNLSVRLAEIARRSGQDSFQAATEATNAFGETARSETDPAKRVEALSEKGSGLFGQAGKIREQMFIDTRQAFQEWQDAWWAAVNVPSESRTEAFDSLLRFWQGFRVPSPPSDGQK